MEPIKTIKNFPDEILLRVLFYLSPEDALIVQNVSKRLNRVANEPLLWRYYCRTSFKYWNSLRQIRQKFAGSVNDVAWKKYYLYRREVDLQITRFLDEIVSGQTRRIVKFEKIASLGYDAKDTVLRYSAADEGFDDVLARRYYGGAVLDHLHRSLALEEWQKLSNGDNVSLERALGAFDLFILHKRDGDLQDISDILDKLAVQLRAENPDIDDYSPRERALRIVRFLRMNDFTGMATGSGFRDLQNNYISIALQNPNHSSHPLISVAIFCSLAQRLGLSAFCCGIPSTVYAIIYLPSAEGVDRMYLDPYGSENEVSMDRLIAELDAWGVKEADHHRFMKDADTRRIVLRTSRNLISSVVHFNQNPFSTCLDRDPSASFADMNDVFYSALWSNVIFSDSPMAPQIGSQGTQCLSLFLERFERLYPMDASLVERYICPDHKSKELNEIFRTIRAKDIMPKQPRPRDIYTSRDRVKYRVGQIFRHKRYVYTAAIIGWDLECAMDSDWMVNNQIDSLDRGRHQSFYHALVDDRSLTYVAEENIDIIEPDEPGSLVDLAGQYFKRWDTQNHRFISNLKDEYPDD